MPFVSQSSWFGRAGTVWVKLRCWPREAESCSYYSACAGMASDGKEHSLHSAWQGPAGRTAVLPEVG